MPDLLNPYEDAEAELKKIADDKAAELKKIADDKAAELKKIADAKAAEAAPRRRQLTKEQIESLKMIKEAKQFATEMLKMIKEAKQFAVEKMIKDRLKEETEKMMIKKAKQFADEDNLIKKAFQGWKRS